MALDGMMLSLVARQLQTTLADGKVDKIYQPTKEELILAFRTPLGNRRLLLSAKASSPRVHLTELAVENPPQPPMFCMLLRKWIGNARLLSITQAGFERVLAFSFSTVNELGDPTVLTLYAEIMGRYSNLILVAENGRIIDSIQRVGVDKSSLRQILPGLPYQNPPPQQRMNLVEAGPAAVVQALLASPRDIEIGKLLQETLEGASPLLSREVAHQGCDGNPVVQSAIGAKEVAGLTLSLTRLAKRLTENDPLPTMLLTLEGEPKDITFFPITQYGAAMQQKTFPDLSSLLDAFYGKKDAGDRMKQKMSDFSRMITAKIERIERKLAAQQVDLLACRDRDSLRHRGDLLSASLYLLEKGQREITVTDYFEEAAPEVTIELDPRLTPVQNVQKYYKEYRRQDTAEKMLLSLMEQGKTELAYLDTVYDAMTRAESEAELQAIRLELAEGGYLRMAGRKKKPEGKLKPITYRSSDGFLLLCGRNNLQNERLTLKDSRKEDLWFHVQKQPGSHVIIVTEGREVPDTTLTEAATLAAYHSKARNGRKVVVDYTPIRFVKKQPNGKPGMVIYENFRSAVVDPSEELANRLLERG